MPASPHRNWGPGAVHNAWTTNWPGKLQEFAVIHKIRTALPFFAHHGSKRNNFNQTIIDSNYSYLSNSKTHNSFPLNLTRSL